MSIGRAQVRESIAALCALITVGEIVRDVDLGEVLCHPLLVVCHREFDVTLATLDGPIHRHCDDDCGAVDLHSDEELLNGLRLVGLVAEVAWEIWAAVHLPPGSWDEEAGSVGWRGPSAGSEGSNVSRGSIGVSKLKPRTPVTWHY